jgi:membrane protein DedA with SNARE-associated domain
MNELVSSITRHGYLILGLVVFAEAVGFPVPAAVALVAAGAAVASGAISFPCILLAAVIAMLVGDSLLFILGRRMGWGLLGVLCRISVNPETCILRSAESFYRRGKKTILIAKFIPGINTMAPPLAGSMKMRYLQFVWLDVVGIFLYTFGYGAVGYVFRDFLAGILSGLMTAGRVVEIVVAAALVVYIGYRIWSYRKSRAYRVVPRIQVEELARRLQEEGSDKLLLVDVRSHGYYDSEASRIKGSIRLEPNHMAEELRLLPREKDIYVYCT